jgi:hypothetical protein
LFHHDTKSEDSTAVKATATATTPAGATTTPGGTTTAGAATTSGAASKPTTSKPTTGKPTGKPTTAKPTTVKPTTAKPTTAKPTTAEPTTAKPTSKPAAQPTSKPTTAPPAADVKAPLLVLNNSRIHGLAVSGAATFRNGGWTVTGTGNYSGRLAQTTVFYAAGYRAAAETLARRFPSVSAVQARPAGVPGSAPLTVVLTRYFKP